MESNPPRFVDHGSSKPIMSRADALLWSHQLGFLPNCSELPLASGVGEGWSPVSQLIVVADHHLDGVVKIATLLLLR